MVHRAKLSPDLVNGFREITMGCTRWFFCCREHFKEICEGKCLSVKMSQIFMFLWTSHFFYIREFFWSLDYGQIRTLHSTQKKKKDISALAYLAYYQLPGTSWFSLKSECHLIEYCPLHFIFQCLDLDLKIKTLIPLYFIGVLDKADTKWAFFQPWVISNRIDQVMAWVHAWLSHKGCCQGQTGLRRLLTHPMTIEATMDTVQFC